MAKAKAEEAAADATPEAPQVVTFAPKPVVVEVPVDAKQKRDNLYAALMRVASARPFDGDHELVGTAFPRYGDDGKLIGVMPPEPHLQAKELLAALFAERGHK